MLKFYSEKDVRKLVLRLREEYDDALKRSRQLADRLREENRALSARLSLLEGERGQVSEALVSAVQAGERIKKKSEIEAENQRRELMLLCEQCRSLIERAAKSLPEKTGEELIAFHAALKSTLHLEEESGLDMNEVLAPQYPLDLEKLCKEMGVMEEDE